MIHGTPKIVLVGTGRIAWSLGKRLRSKGLPITQVLGRNPEHASALAQALNCAWCSDPADLVKEVRWLIIAVSDDAIAMVADGLSEYVSEETLVTHTSGATPGDILSQYFQRYGVFYPLQSFTKERQPVWSKIPFCVDACLPEEVLFLRKMAKIIGNLVYQVNDAQRAVLHVAAVFANNFANHCFTIAEKILDEADLPFEMLHPLMEETIAKAVVDSPSKMQTGPAVRGDLETLQRHVRLLEGYEAWQRIYKAMSEDIQMVKRKEE
jgi:predicted short-subunit dehydrogenase-like oxidoreductase (DUF2520 family)